MQKCVNLVDLVKSFQTSVYYLLAKFGFDTAETGSSEFAKKFEKEVRINTGPWLLRITVESPHLEQGTWSLASKPSFEVYHSAYYGLLSIGTLKPSIHHVRLVAHAEEGATKDTNE